jgi:hypothetical protein
VKEEKDKMKKRGEGHVRSSPAVTAAAMLLSLATIILLLAGVIITPPLAALGSRLRGGGEEGFIDPITTDRKAPSVVTGDNIYIAWWTNNTEDGNEEVMFRASTDAGATFSDKINLSNSTEADSWRVEIAGEGDNVIVSWWETNQTSDIPVARVSNDGGETFGPMLRLAANGTIGSTEEGEGAGGEEGEEGNTLLLSRSSMITMFFVFVDDSTIDKYQ